MCVPLKFRIKLPLGLSETPFSIKENIVKIDGNLNTLGTGSTTSRPRVDRPSKGEGGTSGAVTLSTASTQLAGAGSGAPVDSARIAAIKQAISEGRFQINAEAIADSLIDTARDLLQSQRKA